MYLSCPPGSERLATALTTENAWSEIYLDKIREKFCKNVNPIFFFFFLRDVKFISFHEKGKNSSSKISAIYSSTFLFVDKMCCNCFTVTLNWTQLIT